LAAGSLNKHVVSQWGSTQRCTWLIFIFFYYEQSFMQRLLDLYLRACVGAGHRPSKSPADWDTADTVTILTAPPGLHEPAGANADQDWHLWSQDILFIVHQFKCTVRFVDDWTAGNNSIAK
jgi:hypothetical protein